MKDQTPAPFESGRKSTLKVYLLIGLFAAIVVGSMGYVSYVGNQMTAGHTPGINAAMKIKIEVTMGRLLLEELISGGRQGGIENVFKHIDQADWYAKAMLDGAGRTEGKIVPLKDSQLREEIKEVRKKLSEFRQITDLRWQSNNDADSDNQIEKQYRAAFRDFGVQADRVETELQNLISKDLATFRTVQAVLIAVCLIVTVIVSIVFGRFVVGCTRSGPALQAANQQLMASEQQLRATNQQLTASEKELRREKERIQRYLDVAGVILVVIDSEQRVDLVNKKGCEVLGYDEDEILGKKWFDNFLPERLREQVKVVYDKLITGEIEPTEYYENPVLTRDGEEKLMSWHNTVLRNDEGRIVYTLSSGEDITEQKKKEKELAVYRNQLRSLVSELTIAEDRERKNIASLLHDDVLQKLALSKMKLSMLRESLTSNKQVEALDNIHDYVSEMFNDMRSLTLDLCPPILYDIGLEAAVRDWLQKEMAEKHKINVNLETRGQPLHLNEDLRVALYRAIREVLMNVIKHARAQNVNVTLANIDNTVMVEIHDDGIGFDRARAEAGEESSSGLGLFTVRERMEYFSGSLQTESTPGKGSRVVLTAALTAHKKPGKGMDNT